MMLQVKKWQLLTLVLLWQIFFTTLSYLGYNKFQLLNIIGFSFLVIVPGLLSLLSLKIKNLNFWGGICLVVGFSIMEILLVALIGNFVFPLLGLIRPLDKLPLLIEINIMLVVLELFFWYTASNAVFFLKINNLFLRLSNLLIIIFPFFLIVLSIFGAIRLNNGSDNILTMIMLGLMGGYIFILGYYIDEIDEYFIIISLFLISVALLFMTSLRGWYITGHDIQTEYRVFQLAKNSGVWSISAYRDAYNACLSINILPTIFSNLLSLSDVNIFKILFQPLFAICPTIVYLVGRFWTSKKISFIGTVYFISFTTFFADMPFLIRQEIAFLFYGLMIYSVFNPTLSVMMRRFLFMVFGIGVVLSHYSTTYTILVIFGLVIISFPFYTWFVKKIKNIPLFENSALVSGPPLKSDSVKNITVSMVVGLFVISFLWTSVITDTGKDLTLVLKDTLVAAKNGFSGDNRSIDAISLLSFNKPDQNFQLKAYIKTTILPLRNNVAPGTFYEESAYEKYPLVALSDEKTKITKIGLFLENHGINISRIILLFNQILAKMLQLLAPIGLVYLLFKKVLVNRIDREIFLIAVFSLFFVFLNIVLPILSVKYGIYRAIQQAMFVVSPIIALADVYICFNLTKLFYALSSLFNRKYFLKKLSYLRMENIAIVLPVIFFLSSTSFTSTLFGNNFATLNLNNAGRYYDNYLILTSEVYGVDWLKKMSRQNLESVSGVRIEIQSDGYTRNKIASMSAFNPFKEIFPAVIKKDGYVFLGKSIVQKNRSTIIFGGDQVTYGFPIQFINDNKSQIYSNGEASIYK